MLLKNKNALIESRNATMQAVVIPRTGGPDVLELREVPAPKPGEGEVSIHVAYAGVNYSEVMARRGDFLAADLPFIPGLEVSGHIAAVGPGVTEFEGGQAVAAMTIIGGYAEVAVAKVPMVVAVPDAVTLQSGTISSSSARDSPTRCAGRPAGAGSTSCLIQWAAPCSRRTKMLLENKNTVIYGAGGAVGGAVARTFAREGATVFLAGRTLAKLEAVAREIAAAGGVAETAQVDAMLTGIANTTLLRRLPTLDEAANFAAFTASDYASAMTGGIANLTCGLLVG